LKRYRGKNMHTIKKMIERNGTEERRLSAIRGESKSRPALAAKATSGSPPATAAGPPGPPLSTQHF
jgi:hypothetical protein